MSRHRSSQRTVLGVALQVFVVLVLVGGVTLLAMRGYDRVASDEAPQGTADAAAAPGENFFKPNQTVMVITDSIGLVSEAETYPQVLAEKMGWNLVLDAVGARGFLPTDYTNIDVPVAVPPFLERLKYDAATFKADYIILDGGRNDLGKDPARFAPAFNEYLTQLRTNYPNAKIVVLVPSYISPQSATLYPVLSEVIRQSAAKVGAYVFDPVAEGWYRDIDLSPLLWKDGVHLNLRGAEYYAQRIIDDMRRAGVITDSDSVRGTR